MEVLITKHAVQRYYERSGRKVNSEKEAVGMLRAAAKYGKRVAQKAGNAFELVYQGLHIVVIHNSDTELTVVTCLGNSKYRNWSHRNEIIPKFKRRRAI